MAGSLGWRVFFTFHCQSQKPEQHAPPIPKEERKKVDSFGRERVRKRVEYRSFVRLTLLAAVACEEMQQATKEKEGEEKKEGGKKVFSLRFSWLTLTSCWHERSRFSVQRRETVRFPK